MRRGILALVLVAACQPRTEILLGIATDLRAPQGMDEIQLEVSRGGTGVPQLSLSWTIPGIPSAQYTLPGSYGLIGDETIPIDVSLIALKGGVPLDLKREAKLTLVEGQTLFYRMGLTRACIGMECTGGQTCVEGRCEGLELDPDKLPDYRPEQVTTLTCESLVRYINTGTGEPMPYSEDFADCPYILCAEGTCLDVPPDAQLFRGVCNAVSSFALLIDGAEAGASMGFFRGTGTATGNSFEIPITINGMVVNFTGTFLGDRAYALGISPDGSSIRCDAYAGTPQRYCGTFTRTSTPMFGAPIEISGRVAFVRGGDVMFGQYASDPLVGSFDGWPTVQSAAGEMFSMFWRNEARASLAAESGTAYATLQGDKLTGGWDGTSGTNQIAGFFEADPSRCRATTLPNCSGACTAGQTCFNGVCVGTGQLRFTLEWDTGTDIDLHVQTPAGDVISWMNRNAGGGTLDVDDQGAGHLVENIYFASPMPGAYMVWANNYDGNTAATFKITVATPAGDVTTFAGMLPASHQASPHQTYSHP